MISIIELDPCQLSCVSQHAMHAQLEKYHIRRATLRGLRDAL
jgi:hypothetical protein